MYFGGVGAALREPDGTLTAAADPRRAGAVAYA
jgi:gamma-glutamyltranspeptidase